jgi:hypothetical protein
MVLGMRLKEFYYQMEDVEGIGLSDKGDRHPFTDRNFTTTILDYHNRPNGLADDVMVIIQFLN